MSTWTATDARTSEALGRLAEARADFERGAPGPAPALVLALLEALGRAVAGGAPLDRVDLAIALPEAPLRAALSQDVLDLTPLEDAGLRIAEASEAGDAEALRAGFEARDRIEHVLLGAERAGAANGPWLTRDQQMFIAEFEHLVRPLLARLTAWNEMCGEVAMAVTPHLRHRFWWWCEGTSIAPGAAENLAAVAELVARFPEARAQLDALVDAARALAAAAQPIEPPRVTRLAAWLAERREPGRTGRGQLRVAAASTEERIVMTNAPDYEISWRAPSAIIVDLHVDPREGTVPHARLPSGRSMASSLVPRTVHRHAIALDADALAEGSLVVVLPFPGGDVEVAVPPATASDIDE